MWALELLPDAVAVLAEGKLAALVQSADAGPAYTLLALAAHIPTHQGFRSGRFGQIRIRSKHPSKI